MKISARQAVSMILIAAMLCAGAVMVGGSGGEETAVTAASEAIQANAETNPADKFRTDRQMLRSMQKAQLNDIVHDASTDSETADLARRQLMEICRAQEQELTIEGVLSLRGFKNPVATVHAGSVNILLEAEAITHQESSVIIDLVSRETGVMASDIKIIPIN